MQGAVSPRPAARRLQHGGMTGAQLGQGGRGAEAVAQHQGVADGQHFVDGEDGGRRVVELLLSHFYLF